MGFLDLTKIDRFISSEGSYPGESYLLMEQHVEMSPNNTNHNDFSEVKSSIVANPEATSRHSKQSVTQFFQHLEFITWLMCGKKMMFNGMLWIWLLIPMV